MRMQLTEILACPVCKGQLTLEPTEAEGDEIMAGTLICDACEDTYPIEEGIPNLLPPDWRAA